MKRITLKQNYFCLDRQGRYKPVPHHPSTSGKIEYGITRAQITMKAMFFYMLDQSATNAVNNAFWRTGCAA